MQERETVESEWRNCVLAYVAALSHFLKNSGEFILLSKHWTVLFYAYNFFGFNVYFAYNGKSCNLN